MALSKEQRKARRLEREKEQEEKLRRFPGARIRLSENYGSDGYKFGEVRIEPGYPFVSMVVTKRGKWAKRSDYEDAAESIFLHPTMEEILELIRALTVRYNEAVREMNGMAAEVRIPALRTIPDPDPMGQA